MRIRTLRINVVLCMMLMLMMSIFQASVVPAAIFDDSSLSTQHAAKSSDNINRSLDDMIEKYQTQIEALESEEGAYGGRISQELVNLGDIYQRYGKHKLAVEAFTRSLHLDRINDGLYSITQIPTIEKTITSLKAQHKWQQVSERYAYLFWLYSRNFAPDAPQMLTVYSKMAKWSLQSYAMEYSEYPSLDLVNADVLYRKTENSIVSQFGEHDLRLIDVLNHRMIITYFLATYTPQVKVDPSVQHTGNAYAPIDMAESRLSYMKNKSFSDGLDILRQKLSIYEQQQPIDVLAITNVKLQLADWSLLFNKRDTATELYHDAYVYIAEHNPNGELLAQMFSQPVALPNLPSLKNNAQINVAKEEIAQGVEFVHASFDVTPYGSAKNITIVESNPSDNVSLRSKVMKTLRVAKFRPAIADGNPVFSKEVQLHIFTEH
jgi:tetratricopeptide (TPR) repeat protein